MPAARSLCEVASSSSSYFLDATSHKERAAGMTEFFHKSYLSPSNSRILALIISIAIRFSPPRGTIKSA